MKTIINDAITQRLQAASSDAVYSAEMLDVIYRFKREHPDVTGLNVLTQRAILAGDITVVQSPKCATFELWLTTEVTPDVLEEARTAKPAKAQARKPRTTKKKDDGLASPEAMATAKALAKAEADARIQSAKFRAETRKW